MSAENVEIVRSVYALGLDPSALDRAFRDLLSDEIEIRLPPVYPDAEVYRGREGLLRWEQMIRETWGEWRFEPERFFDLGGQVLVLARIVAEGGASGVRLDRKVAHVWSLRDGRVTSVEVHLDPAEALRAAGLGEHDDSA